VLLVFTVESEAVPIHLHGGNLAETMPATENSKAEHENNKINKVQDPGRQLIIHSMPFLADAMPHGSKSSLQFLFPWPIIFLFCSTP